jgi:uncharacterized protein YbjQ (UPF0145 family)
LTARSTTTRSSDAQRLDGEGRNRTGDTTIFSRVLYQLSYLASRRSSVAAVSVPSMIISTMNDLPGYRIEEVYGEVFGLTVRSRHVGSQIGASFKSLVGGELKGMTKMLADGRTEAQERLEEAAAAEGANAVIAFRFDTSELGTTWTEICAYGTAVKVSKE